MESANVVVVSGVILIGLLVFRIPVAYSLGIVGMGGLTYLLGWREAFYLVPLRLHGFLANFVFTAVPFFLLMGFFAVEAGFTADAYEAGRIWLGRVPGGLASATVVASALFAACSGSGLPAAVALGRISVPEMIRRGYHRRLATGVVATAAPLAILIPPSIPMIIYGILTETSIAKLLIAGIIPGILASLVFISGITIYARLRPQDAPPFREPISWKTRVFSIRKVWGILVLFLIVMGSIYLGWSTATEAAAFSAFGAMVIALALMKLNWRNFKTSLFDTVTTAGMVYLIVGMAFTFSVFLVHAEALPALAAWVIGLNLSVQGLLIAIVILYVFLGMFLEGIAMIVLTMPILLPILRASGVDLVWFGVFAVMMVEIGALTPPVGMSVYAVKSAVGDLATLEDIFRGVGFFFILWAIILTIIIIFPQLVLWLPNTMKT